ncbi:hypothetical protein HK101_010330 [Irineochytrium annulatum]|nr:hypothetical protein HK101_010330 [Irineochytrium annulatum]
MAAKLVYADSESLRWTIGTDGIFFNLTIPADTVHVRNNLFAHMEIFSPETKRYNNHDFRCGSSNFDIRGGDAEGYEATNTVPNPPADLIGYYVYWPVLLDSLDAKSCLAYVENPKSLFSLNHACLYWDGFLFETVACSDVPTGELDLQGHPAQTAIPTSSSAPARESTAAPSASAPSASTTSAASASVSASAPGTTRNAAVGSKTVSGLVAFLIAGAVLAML